MLKYIFALTNGVKMNKKRLVILSGSGVSAESGIKTFRDNDGIWENYRIEEVCTQNAWRSNPELVIDFYNERRAQLAGVKPNSAHLDIASLEKDFDVQIITQNVDNLHERAGSTNILHLHGELTKVRPENCYNEKDNFNTDSIIEIGYEPIDIGDLASNGAQLRPHIVWFGEAVPNIDKAIDVVELADLLLIIGTSLMVYPASGLYQYAKRDCPIWIIDPKPINIKDKRVIHIQEKATIGMKIFKSQITKYLSH